MVHLVFNILLFFEELLNFSESDSVLSQWRKGKQRAQEADRIILALL